MGTSSRLAIAIIAFAFITAPTSISSPLPDSEDSEYSGRLSVITVTPRGSISCPTESPANSAEIAAGLTDFSLLVYKHMSEFFPDKNLVISPVSLAMALVILLEGAKGDTKKAIRKALLNVDIEGGVQEMTDAQSIHRRDVAAYYQVLLKHLQIHDSGTTLKLVTGLFARVALNHTYEKLIETCYGGRVDQLDYRRQMNESTKIINDWVSSETYGKIPELIKKGSLRKNDLLVLANAVYFKDQWLHPFDKLGTEDGTFYHFGREEDPQRTKFMYRVDQYGYANLDNMEVVELNYKNPDLSMYVLIPKKKDGLQEMEKELTGTQLKEVLGQVQHERMALQIPRFMVRSEIDFKMALKDLSVGMIFTYRANFGRIVAMNLKLSKAVHEAFITVDEHGTEAAAATAFSAKTRAFLPPETEVTIDHPFMYLIIHKPSGTIIFMGKVNCIEDPVPPVQATEEDSVHDMEVDAGEGMNEDPAQDMELDQGYKKRQREEHEEGSSGGYGMKKQRVEK